MSAGVPWIRELGNVREAGAGDLQDKLGAVDKKMFSLDEPKESSACTQFQPMNTSQIVDSWDFP